MGSSITNGQSYTSSYEPDSLYEVPSFTGSLSSKSSAETEFNITSFDEIFEMEGTLEEKELAGRDAIRDAVNQFVKMKKKELRHQVTVKANEALQRSQFTPTSNPKKKGNKKRPTGGTINNSQSKKRVSDDPVPTVGNQNE